MSLRPATREDVPALVTLVTAVLAEFGLAFGQGSKTDEQLLTLPESMTDGGGAFWVVVDDDGALLGCGGVARIDDETFEIRKMYLDRAARGRGFGKRLLDACEAHARAALARRLVPGGCCFSPVACLRASPPERRPMSAIRPHVALATLRAFLDIVLAPVGNRFGLLGPKNTTLLDTISEMAGAIRLYEGAGFVRDDTQIRGSRCSRGYRKELT